MVKRVKQEKQKEEVSLADVLGVVKTLSEKIDVLLDRVPVAPQPTATPTTQTPMPPIQTQSNVPSYPIPYDFRNAVDSTLNHKFGIELEYKSDAAAFAFSILVPKEYSNAGENHWNSYNEDKRTKVIQSAYGVNGVREWAQQVYENFSPEIKAQITMGRSLIA